jgi:enoyl-CoA hydratase/carnithine racemase
MKEPPIQFEVKDQTAHVILNRPDYRNAINLDTRRALCDAWNEIEANNDILSVIVTGGEKVFSTGQDLQELSEFRKKDQLSELPLNSPETFGANVKKPVIAAIGGYCLGAGFLFTMVGSDVRIAAGNAKFGMPEIKVGVPPTFGIPAILSRHFPPAMAAELLLWGRNITAADAYRVGYVNEVVEANQLMTKAEEYARQINQMSPYLTRNSKEVLRKVSAPDEKDIAYSQAMCMIGRHSEDYIEGPRAFREKRKPVWKDR